MLVTWPSAPFEIVSYPHQETTLIFLFGRFVEGQFSKRHYAKVKHLRRCFPKVQSYGGPFAGPVVQSKEGHHHQESPREGQPGTQES